MTAKEKLSEIFEVELSAFDDIENGISEALEYEYHRVNGADKVIRAMKEYARIKCLEAIKNTRYAAIDIVCQDEVIDEVHAIQNIPDQDVMPEL